MYLLNLTWRYFVNLLKINVLVAVLLFSTGALASITCSGEVHLKTWSVWPFSTTIAQFGPSQGVGDRSNLAIRALYSKLVPFKSECFQKASELGYGWCEAEVTDCYGVAW